ncbi:hypothetical protein [Streptomyces nymphaeiformis]|uniref:Uncharacterized protein n=1 Tax=Streptomyces nymphaeiformis TaxID=2663842 RepID=A0A7W7TW83_9ACTN|nr:hypothetical protein [Streptomyces nymphaeiformis]MBB4980453.1 hypothetical protein [Streptomyces nymphaeiformis]
MGEHTRLLVAELDAACAQTKRLAAETDTAFVGHAHYPVYVVRPLTMRVDDGRPPVSDDPPRGVRGDPGAGEVRALTWGFPCALYGRGGRYGRYLDAEMTLVTLI